MIKASAQEDALAPAKPCKVPVTVQDLVLLADALAGDSPRDQAIFDTALVAFWSLWLTLTTLSNYLCPVEAILRLLARCAAGGDALFGYSVGLQQHHLTKSDITSRLQMWTSCGRSVLTGHSLRLDVTGNWIGLVWTKCPTLS
ncbi:hypothetical protein PCANC_19190 [Puccinia coronata f. sp. avenae]|uniref:Uncharacterized protein n=1 Tax=Puccinia coronata f. sp. avenae TaxID=200324 RepID=A0A2N5TJS5_9BASI|nr:hypothetical protein PCASD_17922 [Puccinia coronata f. sp. avenae]PLW28207.1 hypothetical protein PCANC_21442 [Puccinia coronata f. sp. avenae]PLW31452.1 hypothetical protein PCANC_17556 [Puccinia coronata f. sp. avenae]PLW31944.1 hypothetical protein PCANC_19190 [Puccinia coronata f. sp. avenae]PLW39800.1 hypothetical protein PCASD_10700 [Puccinia coronata f. sp. avenae]